MVGSVEKVFAFPPSHGTIVLLYFELVRVLSNGLSRFFSHNVTLFALSSPADLKMGNLIAKIASQGQFNTEA